MYAPEGDVHEKRPLLVHVWCVSEGKEWRVTALFPGRLERSLARCPGKFHGPLVGITDPAGKPVAFEVPSRAA